MTIVYENRLLENQIRSNLVLASARITSVFCRLTVEHIFPQIILYILYPIMFQENSTVSNLLLQFNSTR